MKFVFFVKAEDQWVLASRDGKVLTTTDQRELMPGSPVVGYHEKTTVPSEDLFDQGVV